jgi:hypothetical protein
VTGRRRRGRLRKLASAQFDIIITDQHHGTASARQRVRSDPRILPAIVIITTRARRRIASAPCSSAQTLHAKPIQARVIAG